MLKLVVEVNGQDYVSERQYSLSRCRTWYPKLKEPHNVTRKENNLEIQAIILLGADAAGEHGGHGQS